MILPAVFLCLGWACVRWVSSMIGPAHALGAPQGRLAECPNRPNCVATQSDDDTHQMSPIPLKQPVGDAMRDLKRIIQTMPRSRIMSSGDAYLHAKFHSLVFGFVDDVEFWIDGPSKQIHFRSASRVGFSDFGINRSRMQEIRRRYEAGS